MNGKFVKTYIRNNLGENVLHSFDDEPAVIWNYGKFWYKDGLAHRDNNLPVVIYSDSDVDYYKNGKQYWFINEEEYDVEEIKEKFKNNILTLYDVNTTTLKNGGIDSIYIYRWKYLIVDQSQYNLAISKFI